MASSRRNTDLDATLPKAQTSPWGPFRHMAFAVIWTATVVSNIGTWMYNAASGWLMTSLNPDPLIVSLVQVATTLPIFLFAVPAGALADIVDKRKFLIGLEIATALVAVIFAAIVWAGIATPVSLLSFTFLISALAALTMPAWQSVVPNLVPKQDLSHAVAANSVGINISRAIGPAAGGAMMGALGVAAPFWVNAVSYLGVVAALIWWHPTLRGQHDLPPEHFGRAIRIGFRHARYNPHLRATLMRAVGFFLFASAYWALLPLVARQQVAGGPELYGFLVGTIGIGAIVGAFALPWLRKKLGPDRLAAAGTLGTAVALVLFGTAHEATAALVACLVAGVSWIAMLATLNVSAQLALPDWVRGRGLAVFGTVFFGALTLGSAFWGQIAGMAGLPAANFAAAVGALLTIPLTWRWKLQTGAMMDLSPSMHWPEPVTTRSIPHDRGPVLVTVEYWVTAENRGPFLDALYRLADERRRDGAHGWGVFEDSAEPSRFVETFLVDSWLEHLRQHERVTNADRTIQEFVDKYHVHGAPKVTHLIAANRGDRNGKIP